MDLKHIKETGTKVYFRDLNGRYFECFNDKSRKEVDEDWVYKQFIDSRMNNLAVVIIDELQVNELIKCLGDDELRKRINPAVMEFHRYYGFISE